MSTLETIRAPLFVPADRPERFAKAATSGADAVILDLEDAFAEGAKETARSALRSDFTDKPVIVRVNAIGSAAFEADLAAVATLRPDAIMLPKAEDVHQIGALNDVLPCPVIALIESARGLAIARKIAATKGVVRLCADLGCAHAREVLLAARFELVLASRLAGISAPLDGVTVLLDDLSATSEDAAHAREIGMTGKLCIHPKQVAPVLRAFAPSQSDIDWAHRVLASGDGAVQVDGAMVDEPVRLRARAILEQSDHPAP